MSEEEVEIWTIFFERKYDNNDRVGIQIISIETLEFAFSLYRTKFMEKDIPLKFSFKGQLLVPKLSLKKSGLSNNSIISVDLDLFEPGWILFFENGRNKGLEICNPEESLKEVIGRFKLKNLDLKKSYKFLFNSKSLFPEMKVCHSGLNNKSRIIFIDSERLKGAGYASWRYKIINIKFIKLIKDINSNINIFNSELKSILKLCLLKEISSKFFFWNPDHPKYVELQKNVPDLIVYILSILQNGYVIYKESIKDTITEVIRKEGGSNIINFSNFVDEKIDKNQIAQIMKLLSPNDFKEINDIGFRLSKYNEHITLFSKDIERALRESIFEFSIISLVLIEREDYEKFEQEREKCPNRVDKILYHGTNIEPISSILTGLYKKSVYSGCYLHGKGVYFTDFLDYCWFYGGIHNRININEIPKVDDNFTLIVNSTYYNKNGFRKVIDYKYTPKKNEINFAYAGAHTETLINPDFTKFVGTEYVIWDLDQICPFMSVKLKRNEFCVIWRDNNFSSKPVYHNKFDAIFKNFLKERKRYINQESKFNVYTFETSEEALKILERKKYNKIILISNIGSDLEGKKFIDNARKILGNDVIVLFLSYNIEHLKWIKDYKNALFSNQPLFYAEYLNCFNANNITIIESNIRNLINQIEIFYKTKFNFDNNFLNFPLYKESGKYSDLEFDNSYSYEKDYFCHICNVI